MVRRALTVTAAIGSLIGLSHAQLSLSSIPDSCYYTSTVIYGGQSGFQTYSSMTISPSFSSLSSSSSSLQGSISDVLTSTLSPSSGPPSSQPTLTTPSSILSSIPTSGTIPTSTVLSSTVSDSTTPSITASSETPPPVPTEPFLIQAAGVANKAKRAVSYLGYFADSAVLTDTEAEGSVFLVTEDGYLLSDGLVSSSGEWLGGGFPVGPADSCEDGSSCSAILIRDSSGNPPPPFWRLWTRNGTSVSYDDATFCISVGGNVFVVFEDGAGPDCAVVVLVPQLLAVSTTTTTFSPSDPPTASLTTTNDVGPSSSATSLPEASTLSTDSPASSSTPAIVSSSTTSRSLLSSTQPSIAPSPSTQVSSSPSAPTAGSSTLTTRAVSSSTTVSSSRSSTSTLSLPSSAFLSSTRTSSPSTSPSSAAVSLTSIGSSTSRTSTTTTTTTTRTSASSSPSSPTASAVSLTTSTITVRTSSSTTTTRSSSSTSTTRTPSSIISSAFPSASPILTGKRGLAYSNVNLTYYYPPPTRVSWSYNYYFLPNSSSSRGIFPRTASYPLQFIPLLFNDDPSLANQWPAGAQFSIDNYGADALFSFNEPDLCVDGSACMTVSRAITAYNRSMQHFANTPGVRLVAPAITNAGSGFTWLRDFLGNATQLNLQVDILNLHWYASPYNMEYFIEYMTDARRLFPGRPIWITEYGMDNLNYYEPHVQQFLKNSSTWCDAQPWIERYAWFGNYPNNLINAQSNGLSPRGTIWNSYNSTEYVYGFPPRLAPVLPASVEGNVVDEDTEEGEAERARRVQQEQVPSKFAVGNKSPQSGDEDASTNAQYYKGKGEGEGEGEGEAEGQHPPWNRGHFPEKMWWKMDGHMDGK